MVTPPTGEQMTWIKNIAGSFHSSYHHIDADDIFQHLILKWYEKWDRIKSYVEDEDTEKSGALVKRTLTNWCIDYCKKETAVATGSKPEDIYYYSRKQITQMLPMVESPEAWSSLAVVGERSGRSSTLASQGNNMLAHYADLTAAWDRLSAQERAVLRARYFGPGEPYSDLAESLQISEAGARKLVERAITKLQKHMGGKVRQEKEERRRAISNAASQVAIRRQWDGD